jgi:two-component system chemotaxis response regulator CheB
VLLELKEGTRTKFRCHTGHAYSIASLLAAIAEGTEDSLWNAIRALEEGQLLMTKADHLRSSHDAASAVRQLVMQRQPLSEMNKP